MRSAIADTLRAFAEKDGRGYPDWASRYVPIARRLRPYHRRAAPVHGIDTEKREESRSGDLPELY